MTTPPPPGYPPQPPYGGNPQPPYGGPSPGHPQASYGPPAGNPQPPYPPGHPGYLPPPAPTATRIPEDQPFVVRPSVAKRGLFLGGVAAVLIGPVTCIAGLALASSAESGRGDAVLGAVALAGCLLAAVGLPFGIQLWLISTGGPVLALSPAGLWIRTRPTRGQAVWVPWEAVARISRRRWGIEKMLVVQLRDPRMLQNLGTYTALDSSMLAAFYGSGLVSTLNFADRPEQEIMAGVAHYSAGRCPIVA